MVKILYQAKGHIKKLSIEQKNIMCKYIFDALTFIHDSKNNIIHGDLKPENILLKNNNDMCCSVKYLTRFWAYKISNKNLYLQKNECNNTLAPLVNFALLINFYNFE